MRLTTSTTARIAGGALLSVALATGAGVAPAAARDDGQGGATACTAPGEGCPSNAALAVEAQDGSREWPDLHRGSRGFRVAVVQALLRQDGHRLAVDGIYGPRTAAAVRSFRYDAGLPVRSWMGDAAFERLLPTVTVAHRGNEVRVVQRLLRRAGHPVRVDGIYGPVTRAAVLAFQRETGRSVDGVVGPRTWFQLIWQR